LNTASKIGPQNWKTWKCQCICLRQVGVSNFFFFFFFFLFFFFLFFFFLFFFFFFWSSCSNHCLAALDLWAVLSSHSVLSSSSYRTVRSCNPWEGQWIWHWRTTWSAVCSSAPHSQVGLALSRCNRCNYIGPRYGVWVVCLFLSNTPCGLEFSRNGLLISSFANNALVRMNIDTNDKNERLNP